MTKKTVPMPGELIPSLIEPAVTKLARVTVGSATTNDVVVGDTGAYAIFNVPANAIVLDVMTRVITSFTASVTATVGDTDADGFLTDTDIAPPTTGELLVRSSQIANAYQGGKHFSAQTDINITIGGATVAAGQLEAFMLYALAGAH